MLHIFHRNIPLLRSAANHLSMALYHQGVTLTYWNDNAVCFLDNNVESGDNWQLIEAQNKGEQIIIHIRKDAATYRETYGWVDRTNQELAYYNTEHRTVQKQSRILDSMAEMYGLNNMYTLWRNSPDLDDFERVSDIADFRFSVVRMWYAVAKKFSGRLEVLHYPLTKSRNKRCMEVTILSPPKGKILYITNTL